MKNTYCLNCEQRHVGCHSNCEKYKEFRKKLDDINANRLKARMENQATINLLRNSKRKIMQKKR